jgi:sirohydrochlorin ferrochelatase
VVRNRVENAIAQSGADPANVAVAVVGHGTRRNPESRRATLEQAASVRDLAAETLGSHTTIDVPAELGLAPGETFGRVNGRAVYYTLPVGVGDDLDAAILEIARDSGAPLYEPKPVGVWDGFPAAGRDPLIEAVRAAGWIEFGQLTLSLHEVRPTDIDFERQIHEFDSPAALRAHLRRNTDQADGTFRPLPTSTDLPRDWVVRVEKRAHLHAVVETVYPGLVADWARRETLAVTPLDKLAARQTGIYRGLDTISQERRAELVASVCGRCGRKPTWFTGEREPLPCPEACNLWMTKALESENS